MNKLLFSIKRNYYSLFFLMLFLFSSTGPVQAQNQKDKKIEKDKVIEATLNGLKITVDKENGSILGMEYPGTGEILKAEPERSGILDVAYPIPQFEPLRLASRYAKHANIKVTNNSLTIHWEALGTSRPYFHISGNVSATIWMKAMDDESSVSIKCRIENMSDSLVRQVLFPDFHGLLPLGGIAGTYLQTAGFVRKPFIDIGTPLYSEFYAPDNQSRPYGTQIRDTYIFHGGGGIGSGDDMIGRWLDYGGLNGGFSIFPRLWSGSPLSAVHIYRSDKDPNVRLMYVHDITIEPGKSWESPEYIMTPHQYGWAKGIEPYKEFVKDNIHRKYPIPKHVLQGLGFRTVIMGKRYPADSAHNVAFKFTDLPELAKTSKENGLDEMVLWSWRPDFQILVEPYPDLGTPEQLSNAIKECEKTGVNVSLFLSIVSLANPTAARYGLKVGRGWAYHPELIRKFNPSYAPGNGTAMVEMTNPQWQKDVIADVKTIYETYTHSITWDQDKLGADAVYKQFLQFAKKEDSRATFSGEVTSIDITQGMDYFDYTWNWELGSIYHNYGEVYRDVRAFNAIFPSPRLNYNIDRNAQDIKYAFMDNSYVNIMPSGADGVNATGRIEDYPALGRVLKQCSKLRSQFLNYFTEGKLIGECLLQHPIPNTHVNAYVLPDRVLLIIMNTANMDCRIDFNINLSPWLASEDDRYELRRYDGFGTKYGNDDTIGPEWRGMTQQLRHMDMAIYEFMAK